MMCEVLKVEGLRLKALEGGPIVSFTIKLRQEMCVDVSDFAYGGCLFLAVR